MLTHRRKSVEVLHGQHDEVPKFFFFHFRFCLSLTIILYLLVACLLSKLILFYPTQESLLPPDIGIYSCVFWIQGKLSFVSYDYQKRTLSALPDTVENADDCLLLKTLLSQVNPSFVVLSAEQDARINSVVNEFYIKHYVGSPNAESGYDNTAEQGRKRSAALSEGESSIENNSTNSNILTNGLCFYYGFQFDRF